MVMCVYTDTQWLAWSSGMTGERVLPRCQEQQNHSSPRQPATAARIWLCPSVLCDALLNLGLNFRLGALEKDFSHTKNAWKQHSRGREEQFKVRNRGFLRREGRNCHGINSVCGSENWQEDPGPFTTDVVRHAWHLLPCHFSTRHGDDDPGTGLVRGGGAT